MATVQEVLRHADALLTKAGTEGALRDSRLLLSRILNQDLAWILTHREAALCDSDRDNFLAWVEQRASGTPLAYITGHREFFGRDFLVSTAVLIPRPETEMLVEQGLAIFAGASAVHSGPCMMADIGTGSGCIAVSLAAEIRSARLVATDLSEAALGVARQNALSHEVAHRIEFVHADLLPPAAACLDAIFSNPPYVYEADPLVAEDVRRNEPAQAVFAEQEGLALYRRIVPLAEERLKPGGWLVLELGYGAAERVRALFGHGWVDLELKQDLQGIPRCLAAVWRPTSNPAAT